MSIVVRLQALLDDFDYSDDDEETVDRKLPGQGEGLQLQPPDLQQQQDSNPSARYRGRGRERGGERIFQGSPQLLQVNMVVFERLNHFKGIWADQCGAALLKCVLRRTL